MKRSNNKGVTLIALVITIIVLLILAGISIVLAIGENGIVNKAIKAKAETIVAQEKELVNLAHIGVSVDPGKVVTEEEFQHEMDNLAGDGKTIVSDNLDETFNVFFVETNHNYIVNNSKVSSFIKGISAKDIAMSEDKSEFYGAVVNNYHADITGIDYNEGIFGDNDQKWIIFYAGSLGGNNVDNIYLISKSFLHYDYIPETANGNKMNLGQYTQERKYSLGFTDILNEYADGTDMVPNEVKYLNQEYFDYLGTGKSTSNNARAAAYLLDTSVWNVFKDKSGYADFAVGGPSLDMIFESYNDKYGTEYLTRVESNLGYGLSINGGETWTYATGSGAGGIRPISSLFNYQDKTYMVSERGGEFGVNSVMNAWVCSPLYAKYNGYLQYSELPTLSSNVSGIYPQAVSNSCCEIRPVVRLKANTQLERNEDGTYSIIAQE